MGDYSSLYFRIQQEFDINDITESNILNFIGRGGNKQKLAKEIATAFSNARFEDFARKRRIKLNNLNRGYSETWKDGRLRIVIRRKGRLRAWKLA